MTYLGWEELEEAAGATAEPATDAAGVPSDLADPTSDAAQQHEARLATLMADRARLEHRLLKLLGKAPPDADERRENARFPMPIHTAESRMEDRRIAREEERARAAARRALERTRLRAADEQERAETKRDQERAVIQAIALHETENRRRQERTADWLRGLRVQTAIQEHWAEQRWTALLARTAARRQELAAFDEHTIRRTSRALERLTVRQRQDDEVTERLDRRTALQTGAGSEQRADQRLDQRADQRSRQRSRQRSEQRSEQRAARRERHRTDAGKRDPHSH